MRGSRQSWKSNMLRRDEDDILHIDELTKWPYANLRVDGVTVWRQQGSLGPLPPPEACRSRHDWGVPLRDRRQASSPRKGPPF